VPVGPGSGRIPVSSFTGQYMALTESYHDSWLSIDENRLREEQTGLGRSMLRGRRDTSLDQSLFDLSQTELEMNK
jgi:hypothetical protein